MGINVRDIVEGENGMKEKARVHKKPISVVQRLESNSSIGEARENSLGISVHEAEEILHLDSEDVMVKNQHEIQEPKDRIPLKCPVMSLKKECHYKEEDVNAEGLRRDVVIRISGAEKSKLGNGQSNKLIEDMSMGNTQKTHIKSHPNFTRATPKINKEEPMFYEGDVTFAEWEGEFVTLFEGRICIVKKLVYVNEIFNQHGSVEEYQTNASYLVKLDLDGNTSFKEVDLQAFSKGNFIEEMSGGESSLEDGVKERKLFKKYIKKLRRKRNYPVETVFTRPGWKKYNTSDGSWFYVFPSGIVGYNDPTTYVKQSGSFKYSTLYNKGTVIIDYLSMRDILPSCKGNAVVFQYYLIIALLKGLMRECGVNPQFLLYIAGETNSKKTSLAKQFFKLYDRDMGVDIDFTATAVALEESMAKNADAVTIFDDITPPDNKTTEKAMKSKLELLVRSYGSNLSKKRSKIFAQLNPGVSEYTPVLSSGVITGEVFPVSLASSKTRIVKVDIKKTDCNLEALTWHQNNLEIVPTFAVDFIDFVTRNQKMLLPMMRYTFDKVRRGNALNVVVPRFVETFATFTVAAEVFKKYLQDSGCFNEAYIDSLVQGDLSTIGDILMENDAEAIQRPDEEIIAEAVLNTMGAQQYFSETLDPLERIEEDDGFVFVYPSFLIKTLKKFYSDSGRIYPFSSTIELSKFMDKHKLIKVTTEGDQFRYTHKYKKLYGTEKRFYMFFKENLVKLLE